MCLTLTRLQFISAGPVLFPRSALNLIDHTLIGAQWAVGRFNERSEVTGLRSDSSVLLGIRSRCLKKLHFFIVYIF